MCLGGSEPQVPEVRYEGPSDADIRRNEESLARYQQQITDQQTQFQAQLQDQIDSSNEETEALKSRLAAEAAQEQAQQTVIASPYITSASLTDVPEGAQTTAAVTKKKKPAKNLKISTAGTANSAGSGLNIGV